MKKQSSVEDKYIGGRLKLRRTKLGISQTKLAKFEKLTFQQVQKYESGVNKIASGRLYRFAVILHVPASYFFEGLDDIEASEGDVNAIIAKGEDTVAHAQLRKLNQSFLKIKKFSLRKSVITLAKSLEGDSDE